MWGPAEGAQAVSFSQRSSRNDSRQTNRASADGESLGPELVLEARLADDEDLLVLGQVEDLSDVYGRSVGRAKDLILDSWDEGNISDQSSEQQDEIGSSTEWGAGRLASAAGMRGRDATPAAALGRQSRQRRVLPSIPFQFCRSDERTCSDRVELSRGSDTALAKGSCAPRRPGCRAYRIWSCTACATWSHCC